MEWPESKAEKEWDAALPEFPACNFYQSYGWGECKRRLGWTIRRGSVMADGKPVAMAQCLVRNFKPLQTILAWVPGGPAGTPEGCLRLGQALQREYGKRTFLIRVGILDEESEERKRQMVAAGWRPALAPVGHPVTFQLDLTPEEEARRQALSGNWRHNLARGEARGGYIEIIDARCSLKPLWAVFEDMSRLKRFVAWPGLQELEAMREALGPRMTLAVAVDEQGMPCAARAFAQIGSLAYDLVAAVSEAGRRRYAGYLLMWRLLEIARSRGVTVYDLSGADPRRAAGVFHFKKGLGGRLVPLMGEWEWATAEWLRWGVNFAIWCRKGQL